MKLYGPAIVEGEQFNCIIPMALRGIAESLADFAAGRTHGPFKTHAELINSLHRESAKVRL
jgi:hypothetical protein